MCVVALRGGGEGETRTICVKMTKIYFTADIGGYEKNMGTNFSIFCSSLHCNVKGNNNTLAT